jgi:hypothetical protein
VNQPCPATRLSRLKLLTDGSNSNLNFDVSNGFFRTWISSLAGPGTKKLGAFA